MGMEEGVEGGQLKGSKMIEEGREKEEKIARKEGRGRVKEREGGGYSGCL